MGGKRKIDPVLKAKMEEEQRALNAKKAKKSLVIRTCIAVAVLAVAVVACVLMLSHDFNPDRDVLHGTYIAERRYVITTESGTDLSNPITFPIVFCEDGRLLYKYEAGTSINYYEYEKAENDIYSGKVLQYTNGVLAREMDIVRHENGDITMYCIFDSVNYKIPKLVEIFGEESTMSMLSSFYDEEICALLVAGDYGSITDEQLAAMGTTRNNLENLSFTLKNMSVVYNLYKISDEELSKDNAMAIWESLTNPVSGSDAVTPSDIVSDSDQ